MTNYFDASREQIDQIRAIEHDGPVVMLNLLRFKPDGGREQYAEYARQASPFLKQHGAHVRYRGTGHGTFIGPTDEVWDEVLLVEYPNKDAFFAMITDPDYPGDVRKAALVDSRLHVTAPD